MEIVNIEKKSDQSCFLWYIVYFRTISLQILQVTDYWGWPAMPGFTVTRHLKLSYH